MIIDTTPPHGQTSLARPAMQLGICTSLDNAAAARAAGFDFIEEHIQKFLMAGEPDAAFEPGLRAARSSVLPIPAANCFLPGALKCVGPQVDRQRLLDYGATVFRRAHQAGICFIVFGSGGARAIPDGFPPAEARAQFLWLLRELGPLAQAHGVTVLVECLNPRECNFINRLAEGAALVAETGHPHVRLLADLYHMALSGAAPAEILTRGRWIEHVHVAETEGRAAPGTTGEDFTPYLRALAKISYRGAISFECNWKDLVTEAPASVKNFRGQLAAAGLA
ncbi:MAG TPA: sugar phosphate isomerase/epimerase family protein [Candidatus Methylacidiphilales bacterium]|jgi:sugar phosphate isomerase/epimerase|nr:sugar phosphate isomerase/epimerase family protein [Candidatus Methylacidiphilales bacterium]